MRVVNIITHGASFGNVASDLPLEAEQFANAAQRQLLSEVYSTVSGSQTIRVRHGSGPATQSLGQVKIPGSRAA